MAWLFALIRAFRATSIRCSPGARANIQRTCLPPDFLGGYAARWVKNRCLAFQALSRSSGIKCEYVACTVVSVLYRMLLLGEIASSLPDDLRDRHPKVAWRQIRAFRNLAVHRYFGVDWVVVWKIAQEVPSILVAQALAIIRAEFPEQPRCTSRDLIQSLVLRPYDGDPAGRVEVVRGATAVLARC